MKSIFNTFPNGLGHGFICYLDNGLVFAYAPTLNRNMVVFKSEEPGSMIPRDVYQKTLEPKLCLDLKFDEVLHLKKEGGAKKCPDSYFRKDCPEKHDATEDGCPWCIYHVANTGDLTRSWLKLTQLAKMDVQETRELGKGDDELVMDIFAPFIKSNLVSPEFLRQGLEDSVSKI